MLKRAPAHVHSPHAALFSWSRLPAHTKPALRTGVMAPAWRLCIWGVILELRKNRGYRRLRVAGEAPAAHTQPALWTGLRASAWRLLHVSKSNQELTSRKHGIGANQGPCGQSSERAGCGLEAVLQQQRAARAQCTCAGAAHKHFSLITFCGAKNFGSRWPKHGEFRCQP